MPKDSFFTVTTTANGRIQVRLKDVGLIASYSARDYEGVADPHKCALLSALMKRYAGDAGVPLATDKPGWFGAHTSSTYTVHIPS